MIFKHTIIAILAVVLTAATIQAAQTACPQQYFQGQAPDLINQKLATKTREVCYSEVVGVCETS